MVKKYVKVYVKHVVHKDVYKHLNDKITELLFLPQYN